MSRFVFLIMLLTGTFTGFSQDLTGTRAPEIKVDQWIYPKIQVPEWRVNEVPRNLTGKTVVLDFWFTKCAPCVASIPELNHLAQQYPDVVFLSVTFDKPDVIDKFLNKMMIYYPVGSDPSHETINAFQVKAYPQTFLIDNDGMIRWQGSPFQFSKAILDNVLGIAPESISLGKDRNEAPFEESAYTFTVQKHNLEMGESSYYHFNPYDINVFNKDLRDILGTFYGISRSRLMYADTVLLQTAYDLTLKADMRSTTEANCVEMLKYLLPGQIGFGLEEILRDTVVNRIHIADERLLNAHISDSKFLGTTVRYNKWESKGATLDDLKKFLENNYSILFDLAVEDTMKYDFIVPVISFSDAARVLEQDYGLSISEQNQKARFWKVTPDGQAK